MTEFAIVLPVLALLVFAVLQLGIVFNNYISLANATRAGARQAAVSRGLPDPVGTSISRARASAADLSPSKLGISVNSNWAPGSDVTVSATYPYSISLFGLVVQSGNLSSSTTERVD